MGVCGRRAAPDSQQGAARLREREARAAELQVSGMMNLTLRVWRQAQSDVAGALVEYQAIDVNPEMSFLEMLDVVNERLISAGDVPIAFDHDCGEGICGSCGMMINGVAHGPMKGTATCQLHMRSFRDGDIVVIEPWRARAFPVIKDLVVNRSALDRIIQAGGFISTPTGGAPDGNTMPIARQASDSSMDAAACIGCGACVAACPNASAALFTGAKIAHLRILPQGQPESDLRAVRMVAQMNEEGFGGCTNIGECTGVCPKEIPLEVIAIMNRDYLGGSWRERDNMVSTIRPFTEWSTGSKLKIDPLS